MQVKKGSSLEEWVNSKIPEKILYNGQTLNLLLAGDQLAAVIGLPTLNRVIVSQQYILSNT